MDLELYRDLFVHRDDVFAEQQETGAYFPIKRPLTDDELAEHLGGFASYGVYVIDPGWDRPKCDPGPAPEQTVKYVVFDLDTYSPDAYQHLVECVEALVLKASGGDSSALKSLLMESSGGKGYHAWLFLSEPLPARQVRAWIGEEFHTRWSGDWPIEVFPKQDTVPEGGFGNLVKLPFGVHAKSGKKSEVVPAQGWAEHVDGVQKFPSEFVPPISEPSQRPSDSDGTARGHGTAPFACISKVLEEGAPSGCRDNAMVQLAHYARSTGLPQDLVLQWCLRANESFDPPLSEREVRTKVASAFRMSSPHPSCKADWLKDFCPGGETCFAPWNGERPKRQGLPATADEVKNYLKLDAAERRALRRKRSGA